MSNKDKLRKLEEINTALDERVDPLLMRLATRLVESNYTVPIGIALILGLIAASVWVF